MLGTLSRLRLRLIPSPKILMSTFTAATATANPPFLYLPRLRGVVFDMDGTLTVSVIDFAAMYKAVFGEDEYLSVKAKNSS